MSNVIFDASKEKESGVSSTSKDHYQSMNESGELGEQMQKVLDALGAMPYYPTIDELSHEALAGWQKSTISGRLNDLKDQGLVTDLQGDAKRKSKYSGVKSKIWAATGRQEEGETR